MIEQGTPEWFEQRRGKVTASRIADVVARTRSGWGASRANYMAQLIAERLTGSVADSYESPAMRWGKEQEAEARLAYELFTGADVEIVGFVDHPRIPMSGASPDGRIGSLGLLEIKCPNTATHIDTLLGAPIADKYVKQMQWQMACEDRDWCDFVSYDPRMPPEMRLCIRRLDRDDELIASLEKDVSAFLEELADKVEKLEKRYGMRKAA